MEIKLAFKENNIIVTCDLNFTRKIESLHFILNKNLKILSVTTKEKEVKWKLIREYTPMFRAECYEVMVFDEIGFNHLMITYEGGIDGWCNFISEQAKALSYYSVWYPQEISEKVSHSIVIMNELKNYHVLKADFDERTGCWQYKENEFDCNILAFKKGHFQRYLGENLAIYYLNPDEEKSVKMIKDYYEDVMEYYNEVLFKKNEIKQLDIVSLSLNESDQGAYFREELIVFSSFLNNNKTEEEMNLYFGWLMAHELAHNWCTGADVDSWEDWLNETTAEWSALLYSLHHKNINLFEYIMNPKLEEHLELPQIKTSDGGRPLGVHVKGSVLFYRLYQKYGIETMEQLLQVFVNLKVKNTKSYLAAIKANISMEVAIFIEENLINKKFE